MNYNEKINIVVASDENYVPHLETLIVSIAENNKNVDSILIHVLDGGIKPESVASIQRLIERYDNMGFKFYSMSEEIISDLLGGEIKKDRSLLTYARVFIPNLIEADRALYLDVDAIVLESLEELYGLDMDDFAIAGVRDTNPISRHRNVGLSDSDVYINARMILWNLKKCREIGAVKQCVDFVRSRNGEIDAMDQGTINGVFGKQELIKLVHPRFNAFTSLFQMKKNDVLQYYGLPEYYSDNEIMEAKNSPVFVHFTPNMTTRPWVEHCSHPLRDKYWYFREMTDYPDHRLQPDTRSLKLKILAWGFQRLPLGIWMGLLRLRKNEETVYKGIA